MFFCYQGIHYTRTIEMKIESLRSTEIRCSLQFIKIMAQPSSFVYRVFNANSSGSGIVIIQRIDAFCNSIHRDFRIRIQTNTRTTIFRDSPTFVVVYMGPITTNNFISGLGMHLDTKLIRHGSRRAKQAGFMAKCFG